MIAGNTGRDPREDIDPQALADASLIGLPQVAGARSDNGVVLMAIVGALALGGITFFHLSAGRNETAPTIPSGITQAVITAPVITAPPTSPPPPPPPSPPSAPAEPEPLPIRSDRLRSPALVVDLGAPTPAGATGGIDTPQSNLGVNEIFSARVGGAGVESVSATRIEDLSIVVPEGTIISAVLETAINSDLPGYVRAIVGHDVRSFDSSRILIPRGSRVIGQYRSGLAIGESRAFVIWSRIIRPDGVSIQIASPATDTLGRAGLAGKVDRHFFQRFGSAILLSVIGGGLDALSSDGNNIVIGSAAEAQNVAQTALAKSIDIPPTVKVAQGSAVRIFTAKDLYFPQDADVLTVK